MSIPYANFAEVAEKVAVAHCRGIEQSGQYCLGVDHARGAVVFDAHGLGVVHFADRRVTRSSLVQFARLAARVTTGPKVDEYPSWKRQWLIASIAEETCRKRLHVRIPNQYWDTERWTVKAQLVSVPNGTPQRAEAMAWACLAR